MYLFLVSTAGTSELVMLSLDLVKTRLAVMSMEMRKNFIQTILTSLIEKSPDAKILRAVVKIVEEWVKNNSPMAANQVSWQHGACLQPRNAEASPLIPPSEEQGVVV